MTGIFIKLTIKSGERILVNPNTVSSIIPEKGGAILYFAGDAEDKVTVVQSVDDIAKLLDVRDA
jgi:hypothetical protein